jgi:hypothetical protein
MESFKPQKINLGAFMKEPQTIQFLDQTITIPIYGVDRMNAFAPLYDADVTGEERIKRMGQVGKNLLKEIVEISDEELNKIPFPIILNFLNKVIEINGFPTTNVEEGKK